MCKLFISYLIYGNKVEILYADYGWTIDLNVVIAWFGVAIERLRSDLIFNVIKKYEDIGVYLTRGEFNYLLYFLCDDDYIGYLNFIFNQGKDGENPTSVLKCLICKHTDKKGEQFRIGMMLEEEDGFVYSYVRTHTRQFYIDQYLIPKWPIEHGTKHDGYHHKELRGDHGHQRIKIDDKDPDNVYCMVCTLDIVRAFVKGRRNSLNRNNIRGTELHLEYLMFYPWIRISKLLFASSYWKLCVKAMYYITVDKTFAPFSEFRNNDTIAKWLCSKDSPLYDKPDLDLAVYNLIEEYLDVQMYAYGCRCETCYDYEHPKLPT
jgi:hypothetical protein